MAWTKVDEAYIKRYTIAVVGGTMTNEQVPLKYQEEVQVRVDAWFTVEALAAQQATEI
jgi:hypothetical protein